MKSQLAIVTPRLSVTPRECRSIGCGGLSYDADFCGDCRAELAANREWEAKRQAKAYARLAQKPARRLKVSTFLYGCAVIAVEWYLLWQFRGFFYDCYQLWFGGAR